MTTLRIEHRISNYEDWRKDFENDPIIRHEAGVLRYRIYLPVERKDYVIIEMDCGTIDQARELESAFKDIFASKEGRLIFDVRTEILRIVEDMKV